MRASQSIDNLNFPASCMYMRTCAHSHILTCEYAHTHTDTNTQKAAEAELQASVTISQASTGGEQELHQLRQQIEDLKSANHQLQQQEHEAGEAVDRREVERLQEVELLRKDNNTLQQQLVAVRRKEMSCTPST